MSGQNYWLKLGGGLAALAAIIGLWFGDEYYTKKEAEKKKLDEKALAFEPDKVRSIELTVPESVTHLGFTRDDVKADWRMNPPHDAVAADQDAVNNFVSALQELRKERSLGDIDEGKIAEFGLDKPRRVVKVTLDDGKSIGVEVGGDVRVGKAQGIEFKPLSVYARSTGTKTLLVIPSSALTTLDKKFADFRTKKVVKFKRDEVGQLTFVIPSGPVTVQRKDGNWQVVAADKTYPGDANAIGLYIDRLERLRADTVIERSELGGSGLAELGLATPRFTVGFKKEDGTLLQDVAIGLNEKNAHLVMADAAIAKVPLDQFDDLSPDVKSFRDLRVMMGVDFSKVSRVVTSKGKIFQKEGQRWFPVAAEGSSPGDKAALESKPSPDQDSRSEAATLASDFEFMRASDIIDPENVKTDVEYGLDPPVESFSFEFAEGAPTKKIQVRVGRRVASDEKKVYLNREGSEAVYIVDTAWMDSLKALDDPAKDKPSPSGAETATPQAKKGD